MWDIYTFFALSTIFIFVTLALAMCIWDVRFMRGELQVLILIYFYNDFNLPFLCIVLRILTSVHLRFLTSCWSFGKESLISKKGIPYIQSHIQCGGKLSGFLNSFPICFSHI